MKQRSKRTKKKNVINVYIRVVHINYDLFARELSGLLRDKLCESHPIVNS